MTPLELEAALEIARTRGRNAYLGDGGTTVIVELRSAAPTWPLWPVEVADEQD